MAVALILPEVCVWKQGLFRTRYVALPRPRCGPCTSGLSHLGVQMTRRSVQAPDRPHATAKLQCITRGLWSCQTTALLLACAFVVLHQPGVEGRSLKSSRPGPYRRLESVNLPAGDEGWTLGRASYNSPSEKFNDTFELGSR